MIKNIKLKNHKGVKEITLCDLNKMNIICGKNGVGKSSILECLSSKENCSVGIKPDADNFIKMLIDYNSTIADDLDIKSELLEFLNRDQNSIWYYFDKGKIYMSLEYYHKQSKYLSKEESIYYGYNDVLEAYFRTKHQEEYFPILIPPKRQITTSTQLNQNEQLSNNGNGILNHLFFLKNQDLDSDDFKTYEKIRNNFKYITDTIFNITLNKQNTLDLYILIGKKWLHAENCGLGLRDILTILSVVYSSKKNFYLIEEPENHLHAGFQKRLLSVLNKIKDVQFLLSTHSNVFLDINSVDKIYYCWFDKEVKISDETSHSKIINALGYSVTESLTSDCIILTEGPKDIPVFQSILKWLGIFEKYNIKLWPLGGDIMADLDLSIFNDRKNVFAIIDSDPKSDRIRTKFIENCKSNNIECYRLERYATENYFTISAIKKIFKDVDDSIILQHDKTVDEQIGFKEKGNSIKNKNLDIVEHMTLEDFEGTDLLENIRRIKEKLEEYFFPKE